MNTILLNFLKKHTNWDIKNISCIEKLGGLSSENYKVIYNNTPYFIKICTHNYLHTDRDLEITIIKKASEIHIAPTIYYFEAESGNMICKWINGKMPSINTFSSSTFLENLSIKLREFHNLKCKKIFNPFIHIRKRLDICKDFNLPLPASITMLLNHLNKLEVELNKNPLIGLCHNDLNASNIILSDDNLYFVDYEYSSMGDIFFDLATISWFLTEECRKNLLTKYFGCFRHQDYKKLLDYLFVVKFYNATWSLLKSIDSTSEYDYLSSAEMIFNDLLNYDSIRIY